MLQLQSKNRNLLSFCINGTKSERRPGDTSLQQRDREREVRANGFVRIGLIIILEQSFQRVLLTPNVLARSTQAIDSCMVVLLKQQEKLS